MCAAVIDAAAMDQVFQVRGEIRLADERGWIGQVSVERVNQPVEIAQSIDRLLYRLGRRWRRRRRGVICHGGQ